MKKMRKVYLLVRAALAVVINSEIDNHSNNRGSFLPHTKSKVDFWMNRCFSSKQGFRSLCSVHLWAHHLRWVPSSCPLHQEGSKRQSGEGRRSWGSHLEVAHFSSNRILWPELSYFINKAREAATYSLARCPGKKRKLGWQSWGVPATTQFQQVGT